MKPTEAYIAASEQMKSRFESNFGNISVIVENIDEESSVYVSMTGGATWELIEWKRNTWAWITTSLLGIRWPPNHVSLIKSLTSQHLTILHVEPRWSESDVYVYSTLCFRTKKWKVNYH